MADAPNVPEEQATACTEAAKAWVEASTSYRFKDGEQVPAGVTAFLAKYCEVLSGASVGVASESIGGMSQSFTGVSLDEILRQWAAALMPEWYSGARFVPAKRKWL